MAGKATLEDAVVYSTGGDHHVADTGLLACNVRPKLVTETMALRREGQRGRRKPRRSSPEKPCHGLIGLQR